jgi:serine/threonine protein kinase
MHTANVIHRDIKPSNLLLVKVWLCRINHVIYKSVIWGWPEVMSKKRKKKLSMLLQGGIGRLKLYLMPVNTARPSIFGLLAASWLNF